MLTYAVVENNEYELPCGYFDTAREVAEYLGITEGMVRKRLCGGKKTEGRKEFVYKKKFKVIQENS